MIEEFLGVRPQLAGNNFVAPSALLLGDVVLGEWTSVWYGAVVRADVHFIRLGRESNVQDNAVIHVTHGTNPAVVGDRVTIAHAAVVHGCTIEDDVLIGIGAVVLDGAVVGEGSIVGARALVPPGKEIPPRSLVVGVPGRVVRTLDEAEVASIREYATNYRRYSAIYLGLERPERNPFYEPPNGPASRRQ